jgi:5-hydroxyisourate hydrolase-like protein (transthyretin family)
MSGWLEAFIVIAAVAIVIQTFIMVMMAVQTRASLERFNRIAGDLQSKIDPILTRTAHILEDSEDRIASIMGDAAEITRVARGQAQKIDRIFTEAVERLRIQVIRADQILTGTLEVIEDAGSKFRRSVWMPVQQASALLKGLKAGLDFLRGHNRGRSESEAARQDEELFI